MVRPWDLITFDCYGTLIDWETGIAAAFDAEAARRHVPPASADELLRLYHEIEPAVQAGPFMPYREVLSAVAAAIAERLGWPSADDGFLAAVVGVHTESGHQPPFGARRPPGSPVRPQLPVRDRSAHAVARIDEPERVFGGAEASKEGH